MEAIKSHPKLFAGVAIGALLLVFVLRAGSSQTVNPGTGAASASSVDSANQLQGMLAGIQGQIALAQTGAQASAAHDAASLEALKIQSAGTIASNTLAAQIASLQTTTAAETAQQFNTLQAQIINKQTDAQVSLAQISSNTTIESGKTIANALVQQSHDQATSNIGVAQASRPCSSYLFGLISDC